MKTTTLAGLMGIAAGMGMAMDHTDSPLISERPRLDASDMYFFRAYDPALAGGDFTVLVANFIPLQDPDGGPNYFFMDPTARYELNIDNNGDAEADLTFRFSFTNVVNPNEIVVGTVTQEIPFLLFADPFDTLPPLPADTQVLHARETYTVSLIERLPGPVFITNQLPNLTAGGFTFLKPFDNAGEAVFGTNYESYAAQHVAQIQIPGTTTPGRVFVGQRRESFLMEPGGVYNNLQLDLDDFSGDPTHSHTHAFRNVTSIVLEVPTGRLLGTIPGNGVIGAWCTVSKPANRQFLAPPNPGLGTSTAQGGPPVQVERLGMPLFGELFVGLTQKDRFNFTSPASDAPFVTFATHPAIAEMVRLRAISGISTGIPAAPRTDLQRLFFTGGPLASFPGASSNTTTATAEMLRLNTQIPPVQIGSQHPMGTAGGDLAGFPNGRRPADQCALVVWRTLLGLSSPLAQTPPPAVTRPDFPYLDAPLPGQPNRVFCVMLESSLSLTPAAFAPETDVVADNELQGFRLRPTGSTRFYRFASEGSAAIDMRLQDGNLLFKKPGP